jgi:ribosomal protein S14
MLTITLPQLKREIRLTRTLARRSQVNHCQQCGEKAGLLRRLGRRLVCEGCWSEG